MPKEKYGLADDVKLILNRIGANVRPWQIVLRKSSGEHFGKIAENAFSRPR
jgi:hypothetical protein